MSLNNHIKNLIKTGVATNLSLRFSDGKLLYCEFEVSASDASFVAATAEAFVLRPSSPDCLECWVLVDISSGDDLLFEAKINASGMLYYISKLGLPLKIKDYDDKVAALHLSAKGE